MSKTIEEIGKEYVWEKNLGNMGINRFLKESLFQPMYHIEIIAERYAPSQTQEIQEQNAELVDILSRIVEKQFDSKYSLQSLNSTISEAKDLLTKHNHLKSNTNDN